MILFESFSKVIFGDICLEKNKIFAFVSYSATTSEILYQGGSQCIRTYFVSCFLFRFIYRNIYQNTYNSSGLLSCEICHGGANIEGLYLTSRTIQWFSAVLLTKRHKQCNSERNNDIRCDWRSTWPLNACCSPLNPTLSPRQHVPAEHLDKIYTCPHKITNYYFRKYIPQVCGTDLMGGNRELSMHLWPATRTKHFDKLVDKTSKKYLLHCFFQMKSLLFCIDIHQYEHNFHTFCNF